MAAMEEQANEDKKAGQVTDVRVFSSYAILQKFRTGASCTNTLVCLPGTLDPRKGKQ